MSALPPIADICGAKTNVRFVPIADIRRFYSITSSARASTDGGYGGGRALSRVFRVDHAARTLVGACTWQVGRLLALENTVDVFGSHADIGRSYRVHYEIAGPSRCVFPIGGLAVDSVGRTDISPIGDLSDLHCLFCSSKHRLPSVHLPYPLTSSVAGGLISYGPDTDRPISACGRNTSTVFSRARRRLDLPRYRRQTKYELVINLKTAKALGLTVPAIGACPRRRDDRISERDVRYRHKADISLLHRTCPLLGVKRTCLIAAANDCF